MADVVVVVNKSARGEMRVTPGDTLSPHTTDTSATSDAEEAKELEALSASRDADHDIVTRATEQSKRLPQPLPQPPPPQPQPQPKAQLKPQPEPKSRPKSTPTPKLKSKAKPKPPPKLKLKPNPLLSRRLCAVSVASMTTPLRLFFLVDSKTLVGCAGLPSSTSSVFLSGLVASYLCHFMLTCAHSGDS